MRVLLVDDHDGLRSALRAVLAAKPGLEVVGEAGNGIDAVEMANRLRPDVVLMDMKMPEMGGIEATELIKDMFPNVHVVALTALGDRASMAAMRRVGASGFIQKGDDPEETIRSLERAARLVPH